MRRRPLAALIAVAVTCLGLAASNANAQEAPKQPAADVALRPFSGGFNVYTADGFYFEAPSEWLAAASVKPGAASGRFRGPIEIARGGGSVQIALEFALRGGGEGGPATLESLAEEIKLESAAAAGSPVAARVLETRVAPLGYYPGPLGVRLSYTTAAAGTGADGLATTGRERTVVYAIPLEAGQLAVLRCTYPAEMDDDPGYGALFARIGQGLSGTQPPPAEARVLRASAVGVSVVCPAGWDRTWGMIGCGQESLNAAMNDPATLKHTVFTLGPARPHDAPVHVGPRPTIRIWVTSKLTKTNDPIALYRRVQGARISAFECAAGRGERADSGGSVFYVLRREKGAVALEGSGVDAQSMPIFDAIAASLTFFPPTAPEPDPDVLRTFRGIGFEFDYPGAWHLSLPLDDAVALKRTNSGTLVRANGEPIPPTVYFQLGHRRDFEAASTAEIAAEQKKITGLHGATVGVRPFVTQTRLPGLKIITDILGKRLAHRFVCYAIGLPGGGSFVIDARADLKSSERLARDFDEIATSFRIVSGVDAERPNPTHESESSNLVER